MMTEFMRFATEEQQTRQLKFKVDVVLRERDLGEPELDDALELIREFGSAEIVSVEKIDRRHKDFIPED